MLLFITFLRMACIVLGLIFKIQILFKIVSESLGYFLSYGY